MDEYDDLSDESEELDESDEVDDGDEDGRSEMTSDEDDENIMYTDNMKNVNQHLGIVFITRTSDISS